MWLLVVLLSQLTAPPKHDTGYYNVLLLIPENTCICNISCTAFPISGGSKGRPEGLGRRDNSL